jgi:predicted dehydrogenase
MSSKVKVGIIGLGAIGNVHIESLRKVADAEVAALCDGIPDRLKAKGDALGCKNLYADFRDLVRQPDLDAVVVAVPNFVHCDATVAALKAGRHVLCEKPMALNAKQARLMVDTAKASKKLIQMGMPWRQTAEGQLLKSMIDDGYFGKIYHLHLCMRRRRGVPGLGGWFTTKAMSGGGCLIDIGVHFIDLVMWLSDNWKPERISAVTYAEFGKRMRNYTYVGMWAGPPRFDGVCDVDDYASGIVRFAKGCTLTFELSWAANIKQESYAEIIGDKAGVRAFDGNPLTLFTEAGGRLLDVSPQYAKVTQFDVQAAKFIGAIQGKNPVPATGEQGLTVMQVLDGIYKSAKDGKEVAIAKL